MGKGYVVGGSQGPTYLLGLLDNLDAALEAIEIGGRIVRFGDIVELADQFLQFFGSGKGHLVVWSPSLRK